MLLCWEVVVAAWQSFASSAFPVSHREVELGEEAVVVAVS